METYKTYTIKELIEVLTYLAKNKLDKGMNSPVYLGDFEGNYTHKKMEVMLDTDSAFLGYEMHEGHWSEE